MNERGQSIIEYTLIAVLVILGIVYMGPYALRSVNAYFKLWDDSVQDSFEENLQQAPVNALPNITSNCVCSTIPGSCGAAQAGAACPPGYMSSTHTCNPQGCDFASEAPTCTADCACCNVQPQGCGNTPIAPAYINPGGGYSLPNGNSPPCYYGQLLMESVCAGGLNCPSNTTPPTCVTNVNGIPVSGPPYNCALPTCTGTSSSAGFIPCLKTEIGLTENTPFTLYTGGATCPPNPPAGAIKCQFVCNTGLGYFPNTTTNDCSYKYDVAASIGSWSSCAAISGCSYSAKSAHTTTTNNQSFSVCTPTTADMAITAAASMPASGTTGCGNQCGNSTCTLALSTTAVPKQQCLVTVAVATLSS